MNVAHPFRLAPAARQQEGTDESWRTLLDAAPLAACILGERQLIACNAQFCQLVGRTMEDMAGLPTRALFASDDDHERATAMFAGALEAGGLIDHELELQGRDGSPLWVRLRAKAAAGADGPRALIAFVDDISRRRQADEANHRRLLEYQSILDNASLGITFVRKRRFLSCNERFGEMFGWPGEALVGQSLAVVSRSQEAFEEITRDVNAHFALGRKYEAERLMKRRDGSLFWCRMLARMVDAADPQKGSIFITEDISLRKLAQDELEARVQARTAELAATNARLELEIAERRQIEQQVRHLADHDMLTDLPNRRLLQARLEHALHAARDSGKAVAALFIDLDEFKPVNDQLGHHVGDLLLQAVARRLRAMLRDVDTVARVGGDEFVLLLPELQERADALEITQRIMHSIAQPYAIDGHRLRISASIGIGLYPQDGGNADSLLSCADTAMYRAKESGTNNFRFFDELEAPRDSGPDRAASG